MFLVKPDARLDECVYALQAAAELSVPFIRVFGGDCEVERSADVLAGRINRLCMLEPTVTVLLETHDAFSDLKSTASVFERINCPNAGILWDVEHTFRAGVDPAAFIGAFGRLIKHVHLKDMREDGLCLPGDGLIDFRRIRALLENAGYDGYLSLEWEKRWVRELPCIENALERYISILG